MGEYKYLLDSFITQSKLILGDTLTGIYLHGSAVMGCFHPQKSDIDLLIVIREAIPDAVKRKYMDMVVTLNRQAPAKGLELSLIREEVCNPFVYPTPFELHFSVSHLEWYQTDPEDYIKKMKDVDKDLAAHAMILYHRGRTLFGRDIREIFAEVSREDYLDSIFHDIKYAREEIIENPMYVILNLCRVLAYKEDNLILSKQEGGEWGIKHIPEQYEALILDAIKEYQTGRSMKTDRQIVEEYAGYMLGRIEEKR